MSLEEESITLWVKQHDAQAVGYIQQERHMVRGAKQFQHLSKKLIFLSKRSEEEFLFE